jgi:cell division protein FtsB
VAPAGDKSRRTARGTAKRRRLRVRLLVPLIVACVMAFLYYQPISSYLQTRSHLADRRAEVAALRAEKIRLERRFARTTSDAALAREARRIGYVKPGERLFIVKGIGRWRKQHPAGAAAP